VQHHFYKELGQRPDPDRIARQHEGLAELLTRRGVEVIWAEPIPHCPEQHFTRDVAMVIGETFIINRLKEEVRHAEVKGLESIVKAVHPATTSVDRGVLEGGDVLLHGGKVYVGMGARTDQHGHAWLEAHTGLYHPIVPIPLAPHILHLDVTFNLVGEGLALIYPPGLDPAFVEVARQQFTLLEVTAEEQFGLATNVVSLSPETVIADERFERVNDAMRAHGLEVLTLPFDEVAKMGGSLRCTTCPLIRTAP
jgi:N-dimethylarginine dimethylaminohydrolase